jgi:hypothetical protein
LHRANPSAAEMLGAPTPLVQAMLWYPWPRNRH